MLFQAQKLIKKKLKGWNIVLKKHQVLELYIKLNKWDSLIVKIILITYKINFQILLQPKS